MKQKLTISITGDNEVAEMLQLRSLLEKRLKQHLSIAQVVKRYIKIGLAQELSLSEWPDTKANAAE